MSNKYNNYEFGEERYIVSDVECEVAPDKDWGGKGLLAFDRKFDCFVVKDKDTDKHWSLNKHTKDVRIV